MPLLLSRTTLLTSYDDIIDNGNATWDKWGMESRSQSYRELDNNKVELSEDDHRRPSPSLEWNHSNEEVPTKEEGRQNSTYWLDLIMNSIFNLFRFLSYIRIPKLDLGFKFLKFDFKPFDDFKAVLYVANTVYVTSTVTC